MKQQHHSSVFRILKMKNTTKKRKGQGNPVCLRRKAGKSLSEQRERKLLNFLFYFFLKKLILFQCSLQIRRKRGDRNWESKKTEVPRALPSLMPYTFERRDEHYYYDRVQFSDVLWELGRGVYFHCVSTRMRHHPFEKLNMYTKILLEDFAFFLTKNLAGSAKF